MKKKIQVLIVDDHYLLRIGLANSLNVENDMACIAEAKTGAEAIELYRKYRPDVVLMDLRLPDMNGGRYHRQIAFGVSGRDRDHHFHVRWRRRYFPLIASWRTLIRSERHFEG